MQDIPKSFCPAIALLFLFSVSLFPVPLLAQSNGDGTGAAGAGETGDDNPTGVSGIFNGNVTTGGSYDPLTENAHRVIDDIVVPGSVGAYPLKWTRYFNSHCTFGDSSTGGAWRFSYIDYKYDGIRETAYFPDGRALNFHAYFGPIPGVPEYMDQQYNLRLADGGKVVFLANGVNIVDPYGLVTTVVTTGSGNSKTTKITEPGGRYLTVSYNLDGTVHQVQSFDGVSSNAIDSVTYVWTNFGLTYLPAVQTLTSATYGDGKSATYEYVDRVFPAPPDCDHNTQGSWDAAVLATCRDMRFSGPMRNLSYQYRDSGKNRTRIQSEKNLDTNDTVSTIFNFTETRGDGPSRTFSYYAGLRGKCPHSDEPPTPGPLDGKMRNYTDFLNHTTTLGYTDDPSGSISGFVTSVTDANGHKTVYTRGSPVGEVYTIKHPDNTTIQQTYSDPAHPYFLASRTNERGYKVGYVRNPSTSTLNPNAIIEKDYYDLDGTTILEFETFEYNQWGQITKHRRKNGSYEYFQYDTRGLLTDKWNSTWTSSFSSAQSEPKTHYDYYTSGSWTDRISQVTDPRGYRVQYEYDRAYDANGENSGASGLDAVAGRGLVTKILYLDDTHNGQLPNGTSKSFGFDQYGNKLWEENELGKRTKYTYDLYNRIASVTDPLLKTTTNAYTPTKGTATSPYVHTTNSVERTTTPIGIVTKNVYDENFRKTSTTTGFGSAQPATTNFIYDQYSSISSIGNLVAVTDPNSHTTKTDYDLRDRKWHVTDALGHQTTFGYDEASNVTSITRPDGTFESKIYDGMNRVQTDTVPKDGTSPQNITETVVTQFEYYPASATTMNGELWHVIDGKTQTTTFEYDPSGLKTKMTYPNSVDYQRWTYDANKNLTARRTVNSVSQLFSYDARNRPFSMTWSNAADWSSFDYDAAGRMTSAQNPTSTIVRSYDPVGRLALDSQALQIVPLTAVSRKIHDTYPTPTTFDITLPLTGTAGVECRSGGPSQLVVTFPRAVTLSGASVTSGTGSVSGSPSVSADGKQVTINLTGVTNAQTIIVTLGGVTDGPVTNDVKIGVGVLAGDTTGNGFVNSADVSQTQSQSGWPVTSSNFREDVTANGFINSGDVGFVQSRSGTSLTSVAPLTQPLPSSPIINVEYSYDYDGKEKELYVTSAGYGVTYGYDGMGRFQTISDRGTGTPLFTYSYDFASNETHRLNNATGVDQDYEFPDELNRMTKRDVKLSNGSVISHEGYTYDSLRPDLLTTVAREDGTHDSFGYDFLPELTSAQYGLPSGGGAAQRTCNYVFDKAGNRSSLTDSTGPSYTYGTTNLNQYWTDGANAISNGNEHELSSYQNISYSYINDTHLSAISGTDLFGNQSTYQMYYDALGRCAVRILNGATTATTTYYIYDGEKPILEYRGNLSQPAAANVYGRGIDEILRRTDYSVNRTLYYQDDHEGSVTHLMMQANNAPTIVESYRYDAFGKPTIKDGSGNVLTNSAYGNRFMFTGREYMANFGIYEYRNRAYHPGLGRFMSEDPKLFVHRAGLGKEPDKWDFFKSPDDGELNLFRYCGNDPIDFTDPLGEDVFGYDNFGDYLYDVGQTFVGEFKGAGEMLSGGLYEPSFPNSNQKMGSYVGRGLAVVPAMVTGEGEAAGMGAVAKGGGKMLAHFERQLVQHGEKSLRSSLKNITKNLETHLKDIEKYKAAGGRTSSLKREVRTFKREIQTIRQILKRLETSNANLPPPPPPVDSVPPPDPH
jgi:RHS repeat-associated protein